MTRPSNQHVSVEDFKRYVGENEQYMRPHEKTYFRQIITNIDFKNQYFDTTKFIRMVKNKKKKSHNFEAKFYMKVFTELGANYS